MKIISFIVLTIVVLGCSSNSSDSTTEQLEMNISDCFTASEQILDQGSIGCNSGFYSIVSEKHVLRLYGDFEFEDGKCYEVGLSAVDKRIEAELLVFEPGESTLMNICTDVIVVNAAKPIDVIKNGVGKITVGQDNPTELYGHMVPEITIRIESLTFLDTITRNKIEIENTIIWKTLDRGTPG